VALARRGVFPQNNSTQECFFYDPVVLEVRKSHLEIGKLRRESVKDQENRNLVQRSSVDLPQSFQPPYGELDRIFKAIEGQERLPPRFPFEDPRE
jgi:hypothetical protein